MKKFNLFKMLAVLVVLITSVNTAWAADIYIYVSGVNMFGGSWDYENSEIRYGYGYNDNGDKWTGEIEAQEKTSYTYHSYPVYKCEIWSSTDYANIYFYHYKNGVKVSDEVHVGGGWINFSGYGDQLCLGNDGSGNGVFVSSPTYDTQETVTLYYALANTEDYTVKANARISPDYEVWETVEMTNTNNTYDGKKIYSCEMTLYRGGVQHLAFQRYNGGFADEVIAYNNTWTGKSSFDGKIYYSGAMKNFGKKRTYDGKTYIYWKTSGGSIPSGWDTGASDPAIQLLKIEDGDYDYKGFQTAESMGDGIYRYLVPEGDYADAVEIRGKNGSYTGEFGFPEQNERNIIYDYNSSGKWGSWSTTYFAKNAYVYLDNTVSNWATNSGYNYMLVGKAGYSTTYAFTAISNTKLLYNADFSFNDFTQLYLIHATSAWGESKTQSPGERISGAANHTYLCETLMDHTSIAYNLFRPTGAGSSSSYPEVDHSAADSYANLLHSIQTVNVEISTDDGANYSAASSAPATITLHSYNLSNATTSAASNATDIEVGESTVETSTTAVRTATTTLSYEDKHDGYTFVGWFRGGASKGTGSSYVYYPEADSTFTARFKANIYTVTLTTNGGTINAGNVTSYTYSVGATLPTNVTKDNYSFAGWYAESDFSGEQVSSISTTELGDKTYYAKWTQSVTLNNNGDYDGSNGSVTVVYNGTSSSSLVPAKREGFVVEAYYAEPACTNKVMTNAGALVNYSGYVEDGKWVRTSATSLYANWTDNGTYVFKGGLPDHEDEWAQNANWTKGVAPSGAGTEDIVLLAEAKIPSGTTTVNSVRIATSGTYTTTGGTEITASGTTKLTIPATSALNVATNVKNLNLSTSEVSYTSTSTLIIKSSSAGNGALVWGEENSTPGDATVEFYTNSYGSAGSDESVAQYIGIPFNTMSGWQYTASESAWTWRIVYDGSGNPSWDYDQGGTMSPWLGYALIAVAGSAGTTYSLEGTLVTNADHTFACSSTVENVLANSWVAPVKIAAITDASCSNIIKTVYIFNAKSAKKVGDKTGVAQGNYSSFAIDQSGSNVIPSMQSFSIVATSGSGSLTLDYSAVAGNASNISPNLAPRRSAEYDYREAIWASQDEMTIHVTGNNSNWSDELKIFVHESFSAEYENGWDAPKMAGYTEAPQVYAITSEGKMAVNSVPTVENSVVGFLPGTDDNSYTFTFTYDGEEELYLKDTKTNIETPILDNSSYSFTSDADDSDMRFVIRRAPAVVTGMEELNANGNVQKIMHNGALYIVREGKIYSVDGALVK